MKNYLKTLNISDINDVVSSYGQPAFRAKQLTEWLLAKGASSYDQMSNLPGALRSSLETDYPLTPTKIADRRISKDGTRKYVIELSDGCLVETVGIPSPEQKSKNKAKGKDGSHTDKEGKTAHLTVCFSTQVGCAMGCSFCATGQEGLTRNLSSIEMVEQIRIVQEDFGRRVTNVVSMGQGEPFQNFDSVIEALRFLNSSKGFGIGARHITISTCGIISGIEKLSRIPEQFTLAASLHSAKQELRNDIMPRCSSQTLEDLKQALVDYVDATNRRPSLEYTMISGVNDQDEDLKALVRFTKGLLCHVNLIPLNDIPESPFKPCSPKTYRRWIDVLAQNGVEATLRNSRGSDIEGACGQLKNTFESNARKHD